MTQSLSSLIPPLPHSKNSAMDLSGLSRKRKAGELTSSENEDTASKKPHKEKLVFQNFVAVQGWALTTLPDKTADVIYIGPENENPTQNFEQLLLRKGVGRIAEVTKYAQKRLFGWNEFGKELMTHGQPVLGSFFFRSAKGLREEVLRCDNDYRAYRDTLREGITKVKDRCRLLFRQASLLNNKPLGMEAQMSVEEFVQILKEEGNKLRAMIDNPENGLQVEFCRLTKQTLAVGHCMEDEQGAKLQLQNAQEKNITFYDMFTGESFTVPKDKKDPKVDKANIERVHNFYDTYETLLKCYEVYLRKLYKSALTVREVYTEGLAAFKLCPESQAATSAALSSSSSSGSSISATQKI